MRRGIRISIVLAAVLSVINIPVVVVFVSHNQGLEAWTTVSSVVAAVVALISFLITTVTYWKSSSKFDKRDSDALGRVYRLRRVTHVGPIGSEKEQTEYIYIITEGSAEAKLLDELTAIEREAQELLGEGHNVSVIRLRSRLQELGVWSESDIYDFDVALRTRNEIAHGDQNELSRGSVTKAVETMRHLREKLETSRAQEGY